MQIKFLGSRGSLPYSLSSDDIKDIFINFISKSMEEGCQNLADLKKKILNNDSNIHTFSGHTTCFEIKNKENSIYIDFGSGVQHINKFAKKNYTYHFLLTHMHWDHLIGLPYFEPIYNANTNLKIYHVHENAPEYVKIKFNGVNFPLKWEELNAKIDFVKVSENEIIKLHDMQITPFLLDHPGKSYGYHIDNGEKKITIGVDGEYRFKKSDHIKIMKYFTDLDLLVFDSQYDLYELINHSGWGHCSPVIGVDLALRGGIKKIIFSHHSPSADENKIKEIYDQAKDHLQKSLNKYNEKWPIGDQKSPKLIIAYDGLTVDI